MSKRRRHPLLRDRPNSKRSKVEESVPPSNRLYGRRRVEHIYSILQCHLSVPGVCNLVMHYFGIDTRPIPDFASWNSKNRGAQLSKQYDVLADSIGQKLLYKSESVTISLMKDEHLSVFYEDGRIIKIRLSGSYVFVSEYHNSLFVAGGLSGSINQYDLDDISFDSVSNVVVVIDKAELFAQNHPVYCRQIIAGDINDGWIILQSYVYAFDKHLTFFHPDEKRLEYWPYDPCSRIISARVEFPSWLMMDRQRRKVCIVDMPGVNDLTTIGIGTGLMIQVNESTGTIRYFTEHTEGKGGIFVDEEDKRVGFGEEITGAVISMQQQSMYGQTKSGKIKRITFLLNSRIT